MGGHGALHLAFRHPDLFIAVTALGPALIMPGDGGNRVQEVYQNGAYKGDEAYWRLHDPVTIAGKAPEALRGKLHIRLITGEAGGNFTHRRTVELSEKLQALRIEHEFVRPGETGHNYVKYYEAMPDAPKFYAKAFGRLAPAKIVSPGPPMKSAIAADPRPPVCYDLNKLNITPARNATNVEPFEIMDGLYYFCPHTRRHFQQDTGKPMLEASADELETWRKERITALLTRYVEHIHRLRPKLGVALHTQCGTGWGHDPKRLGACGFNSLAPHTFQFRETRESFHRLLDRLAPNPCVLHFCSRDVRPQNYALWIKTPEIIAEGISWVLDYPGENVKGIVFFNPNATSPRNRQAVYEQIKRFEW
jgi:hypothetical protein